MEINHDGSPQTETGCNITFHKFDPTRITGDKVVITTGKRGTGKTHLIKDILYRHSTTKPYAVIINPTEHCNPCYGTIFPKECIHDEYTPEIVDKFCRRHRKAFDLMRQDQILSNQSVLDRNNKDPSAIIVMDNCFYDSSWTKDKNIRSMFLNGRHYKSLFIIAMSYPLSMPPNLRMNVDFVFIMRENVLTNRKKLYDNFGGMFPTFDMFCRVMDLCTQDQNCMVIDFGAKSNNLEDQVFWYRSETVPDFRINSPPSDKQKKNFTTEKEKDMSEESGDHGKSRSFKRRRNM
jgi:hypothetical protein